MLENRIANCQGLINQKNLRFDGRRDRERHSHVHAAGIGLDRLIKKGTDFGEALDLGKEGVNLAP